MSDDAASGHGRLCPSGHPVLGDGPFCGECGAPLVGAPDGMPQSLAAPLPEPPPDFQAPPASEPPPPPIQPPPPQGVLGGEGAQVTPSTAGTGSRISAKYWWILGGSVAGLALLGLLGYFFVMTWSVPALGGQPQASATQQLAQSHLDVGAVSFAPSDDVEKGQVISQSPRSGAKLHYGESVNLTVSSGPVMHEVTVKMTVLGSSYRYIDGGNCYSGLLGYNDVSTGSSVTIKGGSGQLLGNGTLSNNGGSGSVCHYISSISDIPGNQGFYSVIVGGGRRGEITNSKSELAANNWTFDLSLGS